MKDGKRVLIIEDDAEFCEELVELLNDNGFCAEAACDGLKGREFIKNNRYDIILLDFKMPGLNGIDFLKETRMFFEDSKVFIISGRPFMDKALEKEKLDGCVSGIFTKPFDIGLFLHDLEN